MINVNSFILYVFSHSIVSELYVSYRSGGAVFAPLDASHIIVSDGYRFGEESLEESQVSVDFPKVCEFADALVHGIYFGFSGAASYDGLSLGLPVEWSI